MTTDYLLKGKETDPMDIYSQHDSKAGSDMSAEITEMLDNIHRMGKGKRYLIGLGVLLGAIVLALAVILLIKF